MRAGRIGRHRRPGGIGRKVGRAVAVALIGLGVTAADIQAATAQDVQWESTPVSGGSGSADPTGGMNTANDTQWE